MSISFTRFKNLVATGQYEPSRSNMFSVQMGIPQFAREILWEYGGPQGIFEAIDYFADSVQVPSRNLMTGEVTNFGTMRRYATQQTPQELTISFLVTKNQWHRSFFERWINTISRDTENRSLFYDNYVTDIIINKWEPGSNLVTRTFDSERGVQNIRHNKITAQWRAVGCFPYNVGAMTFNNEQTNLMKLDVQFYVERFRMGTYIKSQGDWTEDIITEGGPPDLFNQPVGGAPSTSNNIFNSINNTLAGVDRTINAISDVADSLSSIFR